VYVDGACLLEMLLTPHAVRVHMVQYRGRVYWAMAQLWIPAQEICTEGSKGGEDALRLGI
jgi:hypothetical protein